MRVFVTGATGFVGGFLGRHLRACGDEVVDPFVDLADTDSLWAAIAAARPDALYHVAGQADVSRSWKEPAETYQINAIGTANVIEGAVRAGSDPTVLVVSSGEVYGRVESADLPVNEDHPLRPTTPYGASKAAAELIALQAHWGRALPVIVARPFNHIGPGQSDAFVVSAMARQIAEAERDADPELCVGNLAPARDFSDVRDVVRAYRACVMSGTPGRIYNVCSGVAVPIHDVVDRLIAMAHGTLRVVVDPSRVRPTDIAEIRGDASRVRADTGWIPVHGLDEGLADVLDWWRERISRSA